MAAPVRAALLRLGAAGAGVSGSRSFAVAAAAPGSGSPWRLWAALCLQRPPRVSKPLTPLQEDMAALLRQVEVERSLYSDHELRALEEGRRLAQKRDELSDDEDGEQDILLVQDLEDAWEQQALRFRPGARTTDADKKNDHTSLQRKLDRNLVLLVREKLGTQEVWVLPQAEWQPGESLRGTAERALVTLAEGRLEAKFLGNAPCGHYKFKLPQAVRSETSIGGRVFFFKALLRSGDVAQARVQQPHVWVSKEELGDYLKPKYLAQVQRFLLDL